MKGPMMIRRRLGNWMVALMVGGCDGTASAQVDVNNSYYVPQAGLDYDNPVEGTAAIVNFRACPNNDGNGSLPLNARIKVVVKDSGGLGISGIAASDICIRFNGGTPAQGFSGPGADSVIADSTYNRTPLCPVVRCVQADGPTDANGVTYITFTGPGGVRDPNRKWGHYDTVLPVFVLGIELQGRITSAPPNGTYVLRIKNMDNSGGLGAVLNQGELVNTLDFNAIANTLGLVSAISFWRDLDWDGEVGLSDLNMLSYHVTHDCDTPNNP
jgi:hypothetical protein